MRWVMLFVLALSAGAGAQATSVNAQLESMAARAGVIFAGTVEGVERADPAGYVDVRFRVEEPVRGCRAGAYVLREWAGLWTGAPRYAAGQRFLMLLLPRGPSGLSSPVDGMAGRIPLVGSGAAAVMKGGVVPVDAAVAAETVADVRWVQAKVLRGGLSPASGVHAEALREAGTWNAVAPVVAGAGQMGYGELVGLLRVGGGSSAGR